MSTKNYSDLKTPNAKMKENDRICKADREIDAEKDDKISVQVGSRKVAINWTSPNKGWLYMLF
jgi:hypothetical protein